MEKMTVDALKSLRGELRGTYYPLLGMTQEVQKQMTEDHFLFRDDDPWVTFISLHSPQNSVLFVQICLFDLKYVKTVALKVCYKNLTCSVASLVVRKKRPLKGWLTFNQCVGASQLFVADQWKYFHLFIPQRDSDKPETCPSKDSIPVYHVFTTVLKTAWCPGFSFVHSQMVAFCLIDLAPRIIFIQTFFITLFIVTPF